MLGIISFAIAVVIFLLGAVFIRKSKIRRKKQAGLLLAFLSLAMAALGSYLVQNTVLFYSTPEAALKAVSFGDAVFVVEGKKSAFAIASESVSEETAVMLQKADSGWRLTDGFKNELVAAKAVSSGVVRVYRYRNSEDYYIYVLSTQFQPIELSDNRGSVFQSMKQEMPQTNQTKYSYCAFVDKMDQAYELFLDGEKVSFADVLGN